MHIKGRPDLRMLKAMLALFAAKQDGAKMIVCTPHMAFNIDYVEKDIPIADERHFKPRIWRGVEASQNSFGYESPELPWMPSQLLAKFCDMKRPLVMASEFQTEQQVVQHDQRHEVGLVQDLVEVVEFIGRVAGPGKSFCSPFDKIALQCL